MAGLLSAEVGGDFSPGLGVPLVDVHSELMGLEPVFCTVDEVEELFVGLVGLYCCLALAVFHPQLRVHAVTINRNIEILLFEESQSMDDSEKLHDIVGRTLDRSEMKKLLSCFDKDPSIFSCTRIAAARTIYGKRACDVWV